MSAHASGVQPSTPARSPRIEYLAFTNVGDHREYRFAIHLTEGVIQRVIRIALSAFGGEGKLRLQDGPDICYQILLRDLAAGEAAGETPTTVGEVEVASYRAAHTAAPRRKSISPVTPARAPMQGPPVARARAPILPVAQASAAVAEAPFEQGQRVSHALYGPGVTKSSGGGHTSVTFDASGPRTFVTALLELDVLSGPGTWETTNAGRNRARKTD